MADSREIQTRSSARALEISRLVQSWLAKFCALYTFAPNEALPALWGEAFEGFDPAQFNAACRRVADTFKPTAACPFPTPAHIKDIFQVAEESGASVEAKEAWLAALDYSVNWWHLDGNSEFAGAPQLALRVRKALSFAGGPAAIQTCAEDNLAFRKRDFISFYETNAHYGQATNYLNGVEQKQFLGELRQKALQK